MVEILRSLPQIHVLLEHAESLRLLERFPRFWVKEVLLRTR